MAESSPGPGRTDEDRVRDIAEAVRRRGLHVAAAESVTSGAVASLLGRGASASEWFSGAVVAYDEDVKFQVLGVTPGPVVTDSCAREMAEGVRRLLRADIAVATTGVGGPGPQEDCPAGTVHLAVAQAHGTTSLHACLPGGPAEVVSATASLALEELLRALDAGAAAEAGRARR